MQNNKISWLFQAWNSYLKILTDFSRFQGSVQILLVSITIVDKLELKRFVEVFLFKMQR